MGKIRSFLKRLFGKKPKRSYTEEDRKRMREALDKAEPFFWEETEKLEREYSEYSEVVKKVVEDSSLDDICKSQRDAFMAFVERGEDTNNFVAHLSGCSKCAIAAGEMFKKTEKAFERFGRDLRKRR